MGSTHWVWFLSIRDRLGLREPELLIGQGFIGTTVSLRICVRITIADHRPHSNPFGNFLWVFVGWIPQPLSNQQVTGTRTRISASRRATIVVVVMLRAVDRAITSTESIAPRALRRAARVGAGSQAR